MINIHDGGPDALVDANKFINKHTIVECGGYGEMRPRCTRDRPRSSCDLSARHRPRRTHPRTDAFQPHHIHFAHHLPGFVVVNKTRATFPLTAGCCIGRSGPAAFADVPFGQHPIVKELPIHTARVMHARYAP